MRAAQVLHPPGRTSQSLFASSLGASVIVHGLIITWMLSGGGASRALLADLPSFHSVSLVDAPGAPAPAEAVASVPQPEPQAIPNAAAVPAAVNPVTVRDVEPEKVVQPPQAKRATEVAETTVELPAPVAKPRPVEVPERSPVAQTQVQAPKPVTTTENLPVPAPTPTSAGSQSQSPAEVVAARPETTSAANAHATPRELAGRNSPAAAARAREAIESLRARTGPQGTGADQSPGGDVAGMQEVLLRTYEQRVRARIINAWHLPIPEKIAQGLEAIALLTIDREGQVIRYELAKPSGHPSFDASLQRAVQASSPLPPLPETYSGEILEAEIYFTPPASS